jgi:hypothetical protein
LQYDLEAFTRMRTTVAWCSLHRRFECRKQFVKYIFHFGHSIIHGCYSALNRTIKAQNCPNREILLQTNVMGVSVEAFSMASYADAPVFHHFFHRYLATVEQTLGKQTLDHVNTWLNH